MARDQQAIMATARQIVASMPDGWTAVAPDTHDNGIYLAGPDNVRLQITYMPRYLSAGDRYEITGRPTHEEWQQARSYSDGKDFPNGRKSITVSADKAPAQIARDITRRLLPAYLPYLAALRERLDKHNACEIRVGKFRDQLLSAMGNAGEARDEHEIYLRLADGYGSMRVSDGSVYFQNLSVSGDLALAIAKVLAKGARR
jgi:hypothetical protein